MQPAPETFFDIDAFVPALREAIGQRPFNPRRLLLAVIPAEYRDQHPPRLPGGMDRRRISITDGQETWSWHVDSLAALFRGDAKPPPLGDFPQAYTGSFYLFESHVLEISAVFGDRRDAEVREIVSALRRRPDGRSLGFVHDYLWQAAALVLGTSRLSQAEFEAIMSRLERSCRTFEMGPTSRNYVDVLRSTIGPKGHA